MGIPDPAVPAGVEQFRRDYREKNYGPRYTGWGHFTFTSVASLGLIAFAISRVQAPSWRELLTVPVSFLVANLAEYLGHRGPMHRATAVKILFKRHTLEHHRFFTHDAMAFESTRDFKMVLFPPAILLFFLGGIATPIGVIFFLGISPNAGWLFVATAVGYYVTYEWLHFCYHLPESHPLARLPFLAVLRRHHTAHHNPAWMGRWNFNITFPLCDLIFRTSMPGGAMQERHSA